MKRTLSIKLKLTLWFTGFMGLMVFLCLGLIVIISGTVARNEAHNILSLTVRSNISEVSMDNGNLNLSSGFQFYTNDVYMLLYNKSGALLSGQTPPSFPVETELENGVTKYISIEDDGFYILDWDPYQAGKTVCGFGEL